MHSAYIRTRYRHTDLNVLLRAIHAMLVFVLPQDAWRPLYSATMHGTASAVLAVVPTTNHAAHHAVCPVTRSSLQWWRCTLAVTHFRQLLRRLCARSKIMTHQ